MSVAIHVKISSPFGRAVHPVGGSLVISRNSLFNRFVAILYVLLVLMTTTYLCCCQEN